MKKIKTYKKEIIIFLLVILVELIIFAPWINGHYATDTYRITDIGYKEAANGSLKDGRAFMYLIANIANYCNVSVENYVRILLILALIVSSLSVLLLRKIIKEYVIEEKYTDTITISLLAFVTIFNFMYLENLYYAEAFVMALSVFLNIWIAKLLVQSSKHYYIKALLLSMVSVFLYQGTICVVVASYIFFTILERPQNIKKALIKIVIDLSCILIAAIMNAIFIKIINDLYGTVQVRATEVSIFKIINNIKFIFRNINYILINTCGLFPNFLFLSFIIILTIIILACSKKNRIINFIEFLIITVTTILSSFLINVLMMTCFNSGRIKFSIGALIGMLLIYIFIKIKNSKNKNEYYFLFVIILCVYAFIGVVNYRSAIDEHIKINKLEKIQIEKLGAEIKEYEKESLNQIKHIVLVKSYGSSYFEGTKYKGTLTSNALRCSWAAVGATNLYLNKNYTEKIIPYSEYRKILKDTNYDNTEEKDIIFINDTIYIEVYDY